MKRDWVFDQKAYSELNPAREAVVRRIIPEIKSQLPLVTAVDVGCGVGYFSNVLTELGLNVLGLDARKENILEASRRYPNIRFELMNAEDSRLTEFGKFDLVFCFGLLYHLENPFQVIRSMSAMTQQLAMFEGICYPSSESVMVLIDEDALDDQGINHLAFYPSERCLIKMLYRSGYASCFLPREMPAHEFYRQEEGTFRHRTLLAASKRPLALPSLIVEPLPESELRGWHLVPMRTVGTRAAKVLSFINMFSRSGRKNSRPEDGASSRG